MSNSRLAGANGTRAARAILSLSFVAFLVGCDEAADQLSVAPVRGHITVDGEPAEGAQVTLHPLSGPAAEKGVRPLATVGRDGSFQVTTYGANDGAPAGEYAVTVHWQLLEYPQGDDSDPRLGPNLVDKSYGNPSTTEWRITVAATASDLEAIDLPGQIETAARPTVQYEE